MSFEIAKITEETIAIEYERARRGADTFMTSIEAFAKDGTSNEVTWGRFVLTMNDEIARTNPRNAVNNLLYTAAHLGLQLHNLRQGRD